MKNGMVSTFIAGAAILAYRFCQFDGTTDQQVIQSATVNSLPLGVSDLGADAAADRVDIILSGIAKVTYGGNVTQGQELTSDTVGRAILATNSLVQKAVAGAAAGNVTITGIKTTDTLISVIELDRDATAANINLVDLTSEFTITAADTINNSAGTNTTGNALQVTYRRADKVYGVAMVNGVSGDTGRVKLA